MKLVDRIRAAYKAIGLKPCRRHFQGQGECCPIAAIVLASRPEAGKHGYYTDAAEQILRKSHQWVWDFISAIDSGVEAGCKPRAGHRAGLQVAKALFRGRNRPLQ